MVQNKLGRPRQFDETAALAAASEVFWEKGYDGASLDDLTAAMGMNRPSLYRAFHDKQTLFLAALEHYGAGIGSEAMYAFDRETSPDKAVMAFLTRSVENQMRPGGQASGCLLASCAGVVSDQIPGLAEKLRAGVVAAEDHIRGRFEEFKGHGALPPDFDSGAKARLLIDMVHSLAFRGRTGSCRETEIQNLPSRLSEIVPSLK